MCSFDRRVRRSVWKRVGGWLLVCVFCIPVAGVWGQEETIPAPGLPEELAGQTQSKEQTPTNDHAESNDIHPLVQTNKFYVPFKNLNEAFGKLNATGFLTYGEFLEYLRLKKENVPKPLVCAVVEAAEYVATIGEKTVQVEGTLRVRALEDRWCSVDLNFGPAALSQWNVDNDQVFLIPRAGGNYALQLPKAGVYQLKLTMETPVIASQEGSELALQVPRVAMTKLTATLKKEKTRFELIEPGVGSEVTNEGDTTTLSANLGAVSLARLRWFPQTSTMEEQQQLVHVNKALKMHVENQQLQSDAYFKYEILKGKVRQLEFLLSAEDRILDLSSDKKIDDWRVENVENNQKLSVTFYEDITDTVAVEVHTEREFVEGELLLESTPEAASGLIRTLNTAREIGQILIDADKDVEMTVTNEQGLSRIVPEEVDPRVRFGGGLAYRFYAGDFSLGIAFNPVVAKVTSQQESYVALTSEQIFAESVIRVLVERAGVFEIQIKLPTGAQQVQVACDAMSGYRVLDEAGLVAVDLKQKTLGMITLQLSCIVSVQAETPSTIPVFSVEGSSRTVGAIDVVATTDLEVVTDRDQVENARPSQTRLAETNFLSSEFRTTWNRSRLIGSWYVQQEPVVIPVTLSRRPARLSVDLAHLIEVREELLELTTTLQYVVEFAQTDTFRLKVPEAYAENVQIDIVSPTGVLLKQKTASPPDESGWVTWTLILQKEVLGQVALQVKAYVPLENGDASASRQNGSPANTNQVNTDPNSATSENADVKGQLTLALPRPLGLEGNENLPATALSRIDGEISVEKIKSLSVRMANLSGKLEAIDVRELARLPKTGITAYRYTETVDAEPVVLSVVVSKNVIQEVVKTVVPRALVEIVTNQESAAMMRFRAQVLTSERQRLVLALPKNAVSMGVWIDGKQASLEKGEIESSEQHDYYYVSVARQKSAEEPFTLAMICRWPLNTAPYDAWGGSFQFPVPMLGFANDDQMAVQQLNCVVWTPREFVLVGHPPGFEQSETSRLWSGLVTALMPVDPTAAGQYDQWIGPAATGIVEFPVQGRAHTYVKLGGSPQLFVRWWSIVPFSVVISGAVVLIAFLLLRTSWTYRLTFLLLVGLGISLWGLADRDQAFRMLQMGRFGLLALVGVWIISDVTKLFYEPKRLVIDESSPSSAKDIAATSSTTTSADSQGDHKDEGADY